MGDHRCGIKIEFDAHGKVYKTDMNINYFDNGDGIDQRVVDWFSECWGDAFSRYNGQIYEAMKEQRKREEEHYERAQLERLKAKYEHHTG